MERNMEHEMGTGVICRDEGFPKLRGTLLRRSTYQGFSSLGSALGSPLLWAATTCASLP